MVDPAEHLLGVESPRRPGPEETEGHLLAKPVGRHADSTIECASVDRVQHLEWGYYRTTRQEVNLQAAPRHLVDFFAQSAPIR